MDPIIYIELLNAPELEVEYMVRGLSSKAVDARSILINSLRAEQLDKTIIHINSHIKEKPDLEIEECRNRYDELVKASEEQGSLPAINFVTLAYVKARHYKERILRLINTFGESTVLTKLYRNWRHIFNTYYKWWYEYQESDDRERSLQGRGIAASSFADKLDNLISNANDSINLKDHGSQSPKKPTEDWNYRKIPHVPFPEMKTTVVDFFTSFNPKNDRIRTKPIENEQNFEFFEKPHPRTITQNTQFRLDNFYKIKQKWNLSFDGTDSLNVHDFVYRLEQMADDDGIPKEYLTKVLHSFLKKKAEDWYWVYKADHPKPTWSNMKTAFLSYFSSSNHEEEIKEQILKRFQSNRESFSDFSLSIQKMNARLQHRLSEQQIIYRLCQNMYPALQNVTLPYHNTMRTIDELRILCRDYEKLWEQSGYDPRRFVDTRRRPQVNELNHDMSNLNINNHQNTNSHQIRSAPYNTNEELILETIQKRPHNQDVDREHQDTSQYICWNCRDIGHRYQDCAKTFLDIFCFGCGAPNVRKPSCQNCCSKLQKGNLRPSVNYMRASHFGPNKNPLESKDPNSMGPSRWTLNQTNII